MTILIFIAVCSLAGELVAGLFAGGSSTRRNIFLWSAGAILWSIISSGILIFQKDQLEGIISEKYPYLVFIQTPEWNLRLLYLMIHLGVLLFFAGIIVFLLSYCCRKHCNKWQFSVLWCIGILFWIGHILFLPFYCGSGAWTVISGIHDADPYDPVTVFIPLYCMFAIQLIAALLWLWRTQKTSNYSWKKILYFSGCMTVFVCILWGSAWGISSCAEEIMLFEADHFNITPFRSENGVPDENDNDDAFPTQYPKYQPPRSGKYIWGTEVIPDEEKEFTMIFFTSPELEAYLKRLEQSASHLARKDVLYMELLQKHRSLVRHRMDIAELYYHTGQKEKILPELLKYPEIELLIPADTPFLISELVRTANRIMWLTTLIPYGPEDQASIPIYRKLLEWSKTWKVHLPCEAGFHLASPAPTGNAIAEFFYLPYQTMIRYRGFFEALDRIPELKKLQQQEIIPEDGILIFINAARKQRACIVLGQTAVALKLYRTEHGKYPEKLSELVPSYLPKEYVSPSSGKLLVYSADPDRSSFSLSSDGVTIDSKPRDLTPSPNGTGEQQKQF